MSARLVVLLVLTVPAKVNVQVPASVQGMLHHEKQGCARVHRLRWVLGATRTSLTPKSLLKLWQHGYKSCGTAALD